MMMEDTQQNIVEFMRIPGDPLGQAILSRPCLECMMDVVEGSGVGARKDVERASQARSRD
jgi:hypothetical protein